MITARKKKAEPCTFETLRIRRIARSLQYALAVDAGDHQFAEQFIANLGVGGTSATGVPDEGPVNTIKVAALPTAVSPSPTHATEITRTTGRDD